MKISFILLVSTSCEKEPTETPHIPNDSTQVSPTLDSQLKVNLWAYYPFNNEVLDKSGDNRNLSLNGGLGLSYDM